MLAHAILEKDDSADEEAHVAYLEDRISNGNQARVSCGGLTMPTSTNQSSSQSLAPVRWRATNRRTIDSSANGRQIQAPAYTSAWMLS